MSSADLNREEVPCTPTAVGDLIPLEYDQDDVPLTPLETGGQKRTAAARLSGVIDLSAIHQRGQHDDPWDRVAAEASRYTLVDLFAATTAVCVGVTLARWLPAAIVAGVLGLAALAVLIMISTSKMAIEFRRFCWFAILALYLGAAFMAIWQTWSG